MKEQILNDLESWAAQIDAIKGGRRYFHSNVDSLGIPVLVDHYDSTIYNDVDDYIQQMAKLDSDYNWLHLNDVPVVQLQRYFNDYSNGKRLNHFIIYPTQEYVKAYIRQQKIERIKKLSNELK